MKSFQVQKCQQCPKTLDRALDHFERQLFEAVASNRRQGWYGTYMDRMSLAGFRSWVGMLVERWIWSEFVFFSFLKLDHLCQARSIQRVLSATSGKYSVVLHHQLALLSITVRSHRLGLETENWKLTLDFETLQRQVLKNPWMRHWYTDKIQKENQGFYKHAQSFRVPVAGNGFVDFHLLVQSKLETGPVFSSQKPSENKISNLALEEASNMVWNHTV